MLRPHTLSVLPYSMQKVEEMFAGSFLKFREQFTFRVTKGRSDAGEHQSGETQTEYAYGFPALQRNGAAVAGCSKEPGGSESLSRDSCSGRHQTGPRRVSRLSAGQPELLAARRERDERLYEETIVPGGQETKSERAANRRAGERVVSLEVEVSALSILGKTFSLSRKLTGA